jgi:hypothetical protein
MKKTLALVVLTGLMLTGCGGKQAASSATAVAVVSDAVRVPSVLGLTLDKATDQLEDLGLKVKAEDTVDGKMIISEKNWQVTSQDPTEGTKVAKDSTVHLGVKNLEKEAAEKAAADKAAADAAAAAAAAKLAAEQAAARQAVPQAPAPAPVAPAAPAPAPVAPVPGTADYASCADAKAAGAAPIYAGQPGYRAGLDRDNDGTACDK